ncbi:RNA ligase RtcB family protein [Undibacterium sp. LX40W]|uniref:3'-phosphate/5'-hydroxy nucleic acid ligase n=1 Tax=Undibacterium nitidum TaxID=2762298 RepID=A0A923HU48_9BURK|nr:MULTISPECIES: RNA ligase RtcB family protein [Undibacterium]MBC3882652.1 RNA ligase RtcB family protein [Undibacterium nitidum]MBC3892933.1 RNA ligase RtcB family protein [Undibacterium sp. LX40W]
MGNSIQIITEQVSVIASAKTWIEGGAIQQLQTTAKLPGMQKVSGMPDLHPGRGYPVGAAFFSLDRVYPALIGGDIGCGMRLVQTDLPTSKVSAARLVKQIGNIDAPLLAQNPAWKQYVQDLNFGETGFEHALGTIGGGNHFAELQQVVDIFDQECFAAQGLDAKHVMLLVHSGSRGFGGDILRQHIDRFSHDGLNINTPEAHAYFLQHERALHFARTNRQLIAERICENVDTGFKTILDIHHNYLCESEFDGLRGFLHRKGATPADQGLVIIPGSRGDFSYLVMPQVTEAQNLSLNSLAHGAGRKWMRSECQSRLSKRYTAAQLMRTKLGNHVVCNHKELLWEDAPEAYKPIDTVITSLLEAGLIRLVAKLKPILTYKTSGGCC